MDDVLHLRFLRRLSEEVFNQTPVVLIFYSGEEPGSQLSDRRGVIKWQAIVHLSAAEMTWHALRLEDWL